MHNMYPLISYSEKQEVFAWWENAFTEEELDFLQSRAKEGQEKAAVGHNNLDRSLRRASLSWLNNGPEFEWVFAKLSHVVSSLNSQFFRYDLEGFGEPFQLANYSSSEKGGYGWHMDQAGNFNRPCRKLSLVLQLSEPESYEGGSLQLKFGEQEETIERKRGLIVAFPSWVLHRVTPVVGGNRQSLVSWVSGPAFK
jgi:PKHD-type hydroxylase